MPIRTNRPVIETTGDVHNGLFPCIVVVACVRSKDDRKLFRSKLAELGLNAQLVQKLSGRYIPDRNGEPVLGDDGTPILDNPSKQIVCASDDGTASLAAFDVWGLPDGLETFKGMPFVVSFHQPITCRVGLYAAGGCSEDAADAALRRRIKEPNDHVRPARKAMDRADREGASKGQYASAYVR